MNLDIPKKFIHQQVEGGGIISFLNEKEESRLMTGEEIVECLNKQQECLNEQQATIEKQKKIIKSQDAKISRQYNLCLAMSGVLREEFGVYDVFDRTKDKKEDN